MLQEEDSHWAQCYAYMRLLLLESTCTHMQPLLLELVASGCPCWCWPAPAPLWPSGALPLQGGWLLMLLPPQGRNFHCPHVDQLCFHQSLKHLHSNSCQRAKCFFHPNWNLPLLQFDYWLLTFILSQGHFISNKSKRWSYVMKSWHFCKSSGIQRISILTWQCWSCLQCWWHCQDNLK